MVVISRYECFIWIKSVFLKREHYRLGHVNQVERSYPSQEKLAEAAETATALLCCSAWDKDPNCWCNGSKKKKLPFKPNFADSHLKLHSKVNKFLITPLIHSFNTHI